MKGENYALIAYIQFGWREGKSPETPHSPTCLLALFSEVKESTRDAPGPLLLRFFSVDLRSRDRRVAARTQVAVGRSVIVFAALEPLHEIADSGLRRFRRLFRFVGGRRRLLEGAESASPRGRRRSPFVARRSRLGGGGG